MRTQIAALIVTGVLAVGCGDSVASGNNANTNTDPPVTYWEYIAPITYANCLSCHTPGGIAPFTLETYEETREKAELVEHMVTNRLMPPFKADNTGVCNTYSNARWLTETEIALIQRWVADGRQEGDPANAPALPQPNRLDRVDAVLDPGETFTPGAGIEDDYRCFVVDPGLAQDMFLTAFEVRPDQRSEVHHLILFSIDDDQAQLSAEALDAQSPESGYTCFGGPGIIATRFIAGWVPGFDVVTYPADTGIRLEAGRKMIMQIHYHPNPDALPDRTTIDLKLEPQVQREAFIEQLAKFDFFLPPGQPEVEATGTLQVPLPLQVWGAIPHMHTLGSSLTIEYDDNTGTHCGVEIPEWDFDWQYFYFYENPISVSAGSTVRLTCRWDTTTRTTATFWGDGTEDEMCIAYFYVTL